MMRKLMLMIVLASSVAMPAMAQDDGVSRVERSSKQERREAREARADRPERAERQQRAEQPQQAQQTQQAQRAERPQPAERPQAADRANWGENGVVRQRAGERQGERREWRNRRNEQSIAVPQQVYQQQVVQQGDTSGYRRSRQGSVNDQIRNNWGSQPGVTVIPRGTEGYRDYNRERARNRDQYADSHRDWSGQWRNDRNYDWRHYRDRNRSVYRLGNYWDPYGSNYRRFSIGFNLYPSYYQSNYWLDDPSMYRLPPVYGPYRWIRYYDDALLVNIYSGEVVDVVHSFFW